jgi:hypothetical protein
MSSLPDGKNTPKKKPALPKQLPKTQAAPDIEALCAEARKIYNDLVERCDIEKAGQSVHELIAMTAYAAHLYYEAKKQIETTGLLIRGFRNPIVNPLVKITQEQSEIYLKLLDRVKEEMQATNDPFDKLIAEIAAEVGDQKKQKTPNPRP